jgi:hypothetical protein
MKVSPDAEIRAMIAPQKLVFSMRLIIAGSDG